MKYVTDLELSGARVLVRADLNVPLNSDSTIKDTRRIELVVPTLRYILDHGGSAVVMSHLGNPAEKFDASLSLKSVAEELAKKLGRPVQFLPSCIGAETEAYCAAMKPGDVVLLENVRFHHGEKQNDPQFAAKLAKLGTVYVDDAFGSAHRAHASIVGVAKHFPQRAAGLLMQKELSFFEKTFTNPKRPLCAILGGSKVSSKLGALVSLASRCDKILIGGAMANTFLAAQGMQLGRSFYEQELFPTVLGLLGQLARRDCKVYLPVDVVVAPSLKSLGLERVVPAQEIPADCMALDIGPATSLLFKAALQNAETIVWNGPMGAVEYEQFSKGTTDLIESVAGAHGLSVVGGGDTDAVIHTMQLEHKFNYISSGGGAFLAMLEGTQLPALKALE